MVYNLERDAVAGVFYDEHVYKLVAVVLECLERGVVDERLAFLAIRKAAEIPLTIKTLGRFIKEERAKL